MNKEAKEAVVYKSTQEVMVWLYRLNLVVKVGLAYTFNWALHSWFGVSMYLDRTEYLLPLILLVYIDTCVRQVIKALIKIDKKQP